MVEAANVRSSRIKSHREKNDASKDEILNSQSDHSNQTPKGQCTDTEKSIDNTDEIGDGTQSNNTNDTVNDASKDETLNENSSESARSYVKKTKSKTKNVRLSHRLFEFALLFIVLIHFIGILKLIFRKRDRLKSLKNSKKVQQLKFQLKLISRLHNPITIHHMTMNFWSYHLNHLDPVTTPMRMTMTISMRLIQSLK